MRPLRALVITIVVLFASAPAWAQDAGAARVREIEREIAQLKQQIGKLSMDERNAERKAKEEFEAAKTAARRLRDQQDRDEQREYETKVRELGDLERKHKDEGRTLAAELRFIRERQDAAQDELAEARRKRESIDGPSAEILGLRRELTEKTNALRKAERDAEAVPHQREQLRQEHRKNDQEIREAYTKAIEAAEKKHATDLKDARAKHDGLKTLKEQLHEKTRELAQVGEKSRRIAGVQREIEGFERDIRRLEGVVRLYKSNLDDVRRSLESARRTAAVTKDPSERRRAEEAVRRLDGQARDYESGLLRNEREIENLRKIVAEKQRDIQLAAQAR